MRILDGYVAKEMLMPMLFGVCAFTSLFVGTDLLAKGFSLAIILY